MSGDVVDIAIGSIVVAGLIALLWELAHRTRSVGAPRIDRSIFDPAMVNNIQHQIVPYIISADLLPKLPQYTLFRVYSYLRALLAGIVGLGIAPPVIAYLNRVAETSPQAGQTPVTVPPGLNYVAITAAILLTAFAIYVNQTNLDKRAVLADSCSAEFRGLYAKLLQLAARSDVSQLDALSNQIATVVQRHIAEKDWVFEHVIAPGIAEQARSMTDDVLSRFPPPPSAGSGAAAPPNRITIQQIEK